MLRDHSDIMLRAFYKLTGEGFTIEAKILGPIWDKFLDFVVIFKG